MSKARKLDTASAVAALLSEGGDRLVVTTEAKYIDVERDHERKGRLKPIKVARADGTVDEIGVRDYLEGVVAARQTAELQDALPECACCGRRKPPVAMRQRRRGVTLCGECPSCACGSRLSDQYMGAKAVHRRGGKRPVCRACHRARVAAAAKGSPQCDSCGGRVTVGRGAAATAPPHHCRKCKSALSRAARAKCFRCDTSISVSAVARAERERRDPVCRPCWRKNRPLEERLRHGARMRAGTNAERRAARGRQQGARNRGFTDRVAIKLLAKLGMGQPMAHLAKEHGVSSGTIRNLYTGHSYPHLDAYRPWKTKGAPA